MPLLQSFPFKFPVFFLTSRNLFDLQEDVSPLFCFLRHQIRIIIQFCAEGKLTSTLLL
jgi:hypothetical protein